jgi:hypothetical protein
MPGAKGSRSIATAGLILALLLLLGGGTAAAFTFPVKTLKADKAMAEMLPASTAVLVSADLNPTGTEKTNLRAIEHDFTDQPGWSKVLASVNQTTRRNADTSDCFNRTQGQVTANLDKLSGQVAFALIDAHGINLSQVDLAPSPSQATQQFEKKGVVLAALHVQLSLVGILSGFHLSLPQKALDYHGVTIYQETIPSCQKANSNLPQTFYAALDQGYIVLGLQPDPIKRVIDTAAGAAPSLATNNTYRALEAQLPHDQLGGYYYDARSLLSTSGLFSSLERMSPVGTFHTSVYAREARPAAGALTVDAGGFRLAMASLISSRPSSATAGTLATHLPASTLAMLSLQGLAPSLNGSVRQIEQQGLLDTTTAGSLQPIVDDLTADMSGETDLVMLHPAGRITPNLANTTSIPLSLAWQVRDGASARAHLDDLVRRVGGAGQFQAATMPDGTPYAVSSGGYGYAFSRGWAVVSLSIRDTLQTLTGRPAHNLASLPAYRAALLMGNSPSSVWYLDLRGLRTTIENVVLPSLSAKQRSQYIAQVQPFLAPIQSISGSSGPSSHSVTTAVFRVTIGKA